LNTWHAQVSEVASTIGHDFVNDKDLPNPASVFAGYKELVDSIVPDQVWKTYICDVCTTGEVEVMEYRKFTGDRCWNAHLKSRRHRKTVSHLANKAKIAMYLEK
jgi:hypothetical protein